MRQHYYIASHDITSAEVTEAVRSRWLLDVILEEDTSTVRKDNAPESLRYSKK